MNCIQPSAPAEETLRLVPKAVSIRLIPARTAGPCGPSRYSAAARRYIGIRTGGTPVAAQLELGREGIASAAAGLGTASAPSEPSAAGASSAPSPAGSLEPSPAATPPSAGGAVGAAAGGARVVPCCTEAGANAPAGSSSVAP